MDDLEWLKNKGRNGWDSALRVQPDQSVESRNVHFVALCGTPVVSFARWRGDGFFDGPIPEKSSTQRLNAKIDAPRPFSQDEGLAVQRQADVVATVTHLFFFGCPSAILRRIRAIVIDAINRVPHGWARSHVFAERGEAVAPTVAHHNAATTVVAIDCRGGNVAARPHASPNGITVIQLDTPRTKYASHPPILLLAECGWA